jgi:purine-binding chemotaxis protein CheW
VNGTTETDRGGACEVPLAEQPLLLISTFYLRDALFALDTALVEEVVRLRRVTRVARAPEYVLGIMNLRGKIVTVLDLAAILQLGPAAPGDESRLYIVRDGDGLAGLLVDRAADVIELDTALLEQPPASVSGAEGRFFQGITRTGDHLVAVLDLPAVLALEAV